MTKPMSNFHFKMMSLILSLRYLYKNPAVTLKEAGITSGVTVLDYGCGPGYYSIVAAEMVSETGKIYALDILPMAVEKVRKTG